MAEDEVSQALTPLLQAAAGRASKELAESLGADLEADAEPAGPLGAQALADQASDGAVVLAGSLAGAVEAPILFYMERGDAMRLACRAQQVPEEQVEERLGQAPGEEDLAAIAFALARIGAAASAVWEEQAQGVAWPSEPTDLRPQLIDSPEALEEALGSLGEEAEPLGFRVRLGEPVGASLLLLVPAATGRELVGGGTPQAGAAKGLPRELSRLLRVPFAARVVIARRQVTVRELLQLAPGHVFELQRGAQEPLELRAGEKLLARGEAVTVDERLGFRVAEVHRGSSEGRKG
ncbi:MAG: FliM/FliN family flagellar motor switch protein [Candidatus Brocadiia bacterium]